MSTLPPSSAPLPLVPWHFFAPLGCAALGVASEYSGFDLWLARHFYDAGTGTWTYREHPLAKSVLHDGAQKVLVALGVGLLAANLLSLFWRPLRPKRRILGFLTLAVLVGPLWIGWIKSQARIYIPWDLESFGGTRPYVRVLDPRPRGLPAGRAIPSAHAAGGYAWFSLYFLALQFRPSWRLGGLVLPIALGLLLGGTQQVRGAHFASHDLFSAAICWLVCLGLFHLYRQLGWFDAPPQRS